VVSVSRPGWSSTDFGVISLKSSAIGELPALSLQRRTHLDTASWCLSDGDVKEDNWPCDARGSIKHCRHLVVTFSPDVRLNMLDCNKSTTFTCFSHIVLGLLVIEVVHPQRPCRLLWASGRAQPWSSNVSREWSMELIGSLALLGHSSLLCAGSF
jgi:hypothetical protein